MNKYQIHNIFTKLAKASFKKAKIKENKMQNNNILLKKTLKELEKKS